MAEGTVNRVALGIGANIGDRLGSIRRARRMLHDLAGAIAGQSDVYETAPWGESGQPRFMNACVVLDTGLAPLALLDVIKGIEESMGRVKRARWMEREIDIDILLYNDSVIMSSELTVPHPFMHERAFVLLPLSAIAPDWLHPKLHVSARDMLKSLDCGDIVRIAGI